MDGCLVISVSSCASIVMSVCNHAYNKKKNQKIEVNGEVKSSKSMRINTGYPNLLHGCDFLCFNLMNH